MKDQRGTSYVGILFVIMGFLFLAKIAIAVWGPLWDNRVIESQIEELIVTLPANTPPDKFLDQLESRLTMNNIRDFDVKKNVLAENAGGIKAKLNYEVSKNFMMNIYLVTKFEKEFDKSTVQAK